jgi:hypothetical protein
MRIKIASTTNVYGRFRAMRTMAFIDAPDSACQLRRPCR